MPNEGSDVDKQSADPRDEGLALLGEDAIIRFGIFCCAVTMIVVLAVALAAY